MHLGVSNVMTIALFSPTISLLSVEISAEMVRLALQQGDRRSFEGIFHSLYAPLCRHAWSFLREQEEAEELVQQAFVTLWEKRESIVIDISIEAFLYRAVRNAALNKLKHLKVVKRHQDHSLRSGVAIQAPVEDLLTLELEQKIAGALAKLPEQCGLVFRMSRMEGLKYQEIADQLGISIKTVENHMGKALRLLREDLAEYLPLLLLLLEPIFLN